MTKIITALIVGAISGAIVGALILGGLGWFSEGSVGSGDESRWALLGLYLGAKLGVLLGAMLGTLVGSLWTLYDHRRQSRTLR